MDFAVKENELGRALTQHFQEQPGTGILPFRVPLEHISSSSSKLTGRHTCVPISIQAPGMKG